MLMTDLKEQFSKVRGGDKEAFAYIYNELRKPVFTIACRIVQSAAAAEDITSDVFVKLFVSPPEHSVKNPRAWVFQMTRNLSLDALKKKQCADIDEVTLAARDELCDAALRIDIETAIGRLPCAEREILSLHLCGGLGFAEISRIVEMSVPAVYRKYRKALASVRDYLGGAL